ncbi:MAG: YicC/YloC family endoribonuclease [Bacteroidota bacterium]
MLKSMTGYGKAIAEYGGKTYTIEVKSLNSKFLDLSLRLPNGLREKELEIRSEITKRLERGKVEVSVNTDNGVQKSVHINNDLFKTYFEELSMLKTELNIEAGDIMRTIITIPDVLTSPRKETDENEMQALMDGVNAAITGCDNFRIQEGKQTATEIKLRIDSIRNLVGQVAILDAPRIENVKTRLRTNLLEIISKNNFDENRFEQELVFYIEKMDMTEEKIRLVAHLNYFDETMKDTVSIGKKLAFISQEIGREINTMGSKANDAEIQKLVVQMKDELEKIKEQLNNIL